MAVARAVASLPFHGYVETTFHALRLIQAAREGVIPRITRRLNDHERRTMIKSGAVFVFSVEESRIKRWTDGLLWSPSRIVGNFLVYREVTERTLNRGSGRRPYPVDASLFDGSRDGISWSNDNANQPTLKPGGLVKKTITVTVDGTDLHLISYYTTKDLNEGFLDTPTSRPDIMTLDIRPEIFRLSNLRIPPKIEMGTDGTARIVPEPEDLAPPTVRAKMPYSSSTHFKREDTHEMGFDSQTYMPSYHRHDYQWVSPVSDTMHSPSLRRQDTSPQRVVIKREYDDDPGPSSPPVQYDVGLFSGYDRPRGRISPEGRYEDTYPLQRHARRSPHLQWAPGSVNDTYNPYGTCHPGYHAQTASLSPEVYPEDEHHHSSYSNTPWNEEHQYMSKDPNLYGHADIYEASSPSGTAWE